MVLNGALANGSEAAAHVGFGLSDVVLVQPQVDAANAGAVGDIAVEWKNQDKTNCFDKTVTVKKLSPEECTGVELISAMETVQHESGDEPVTGSILTGSQALIKMMPKLFQLVQTNASCVVQVAASKLDETQTCVESDLSEVMAIRETGVAMLSAGSVQEIHDLAVIAHIASMKSGVPFVNFWDGTRVTSSLEKVKLAPYKDLQQLVSAGTSTGNVGETVDMVMQQCEEALGKRYQAFEYIGPHDADAVIITMGTAALALTEVIRNKLGDKLKSEKWTVGVLVVRMFRPFATQKFLQALPSTTKCVCVIDQNTRGDTPLFKDIASAFHSDAQWQAPKLLSGNIVTNSKTGFTPAISHAIIENVLSENPKTNFTVDQLQIENLLSNNLAYSSELVKQLVFWTMTGCDSDSNSKEQQWRNVLAVVLGPFLNYQTQQQDSISVNTGVSRSDIRFAPVEINAEYPILAADVISCDDQGILLLPNCNVLAQAKPGTKLLVNATWTNSKQAQADLDEKLLNRIAKLNIKLFAIDATKLAAKESNWVMQAANAFLIASSYSLEYRHVYSHLSELLLNNVEGAASFVELLSDKNMGSLVHEIKYDSNEWGIESSTASDQELELDFCPYDMMPLGIMESQDIASVGQASSPTTTAYSKLLHQLFGPRLILADTTDQPVPSALALNSSETEQKVSNTLESCFGSYLVKEQARNRLFAFVEKALSGSSDLKSSGVSSDLIATLGMWHGVSNDASRCAKVVPRLLELLHAEKHKNHALEHIYKNKQLLQKPSKWILGGTNWSYDVSNSGIRHILSSGKNVNVLILDSGIHGQALESVQDQIVSAADVSVDLNASAMSVVSHTEAAASSSSSSSSSSAAADPTSRRKKDIGLFAMNYGTAYVASVSVLASQAQALRALGEADSFNGPSIVIAHAPQVTQMLAEAASKAVESGSWPLYRWNPSADQEFTLDSAKLKAEIEEFLKREQNLSILARTQPKLDKALTSDTLESKRATQHEELHKRAEQRRLDESFDKLVSGVGGSANRNLNLLVLYGSDGGNGSSLAEKLAKKAEVSGCGEARCLEANEFNVDDLGEESTVLFVLSTAGQGEPSANAKNFTEELMASSNKLTGVNYAVFGLGDSHYWGANTEDSKKYFCLNARMVDSQMANLGASKIVDVGLGDDQADDGFEGALSEWEPAMWDALGVTIVGGDLGGPPPIVDDDIKGGSNFLRGMIDEGLQDHTTGKLLPEDTKLTKFHGIYQQDLRSVREELDAKGLERAYSFMIRAGLPGGVGTAEQYIGMDDLCHKYCFDTLKLTTRQAYQVHGVVKRDLKATMKAINRATLDTLAACGDVNRNIIANPHLHNSPAHMQVSQLAKDLQAHLRPKTSAYAEIWLDEKPVGGSVDHEPIYGSTYLPRKWKIALAVPPLNDVDVFSHCLGFIAIIENGKLQGFNITVGGGMGQSGGGFGSEGARAIYPRLSDVLGFCKPHECIKIAEACVIIQRDHGERENRKHARFKYTVEDLGLSVVKAKIEAYTGYKIGAKRPFKFTSNADPYGWLKTSNGNYQYTLFIENGRVHDRNDYKLRTALREIAETIVGGGLMSLTATQNLIVGNVTPEQKPLVEAIMKRYNVDNTQHSQMRLHSQACQALPTCALAFAEAQTYMPTLLSKLEVILEKCNLMQVPITIRMTGCPNGCARPVMAEIGFIGKAPGTYNMYLGGGFAGNRLARIYKEGVNEEEILQILEPMLQDYSSNRTTGEHFGDFCIRRNHVHPVYHGRCSWIKDPKLNDNTSASGTTQLYW